MAQGRVLGPLFFVAYISPIAKIAGKLNVHQYADDTQAVRCSVEKVDYRCSQSKPANLSCCRSHVIHSEWTSRQPREIGGVAPMHSTVIKSGSVASQRHECCRLRCRTHRCRQEGYGQFADTAFRCRRSADAAFPRRALRRFSASSHAVSPTRRFAARRFTGAHCTTFRREEFWIEG